VQDALRAVFAQGLDVNRFEMKEPTLHDAFIVLTGSNVPVQSPRAA
jgi:ABC-2 type transport system ATP-binding protein